MDGRHAFRCDSRPPARFRRGSGILIGKRRPRHWWRTRKKSRCWRGCQRQREHHHRGEHRQLQQHANRVPDILRRSSRNLIRSPPANSRVISPRASAKSSGPDRWHRSVAGRVPLPPAPEQVGGSPRPGSGFLRDADPCRCLPAAVAGLATPLIEAEIDVAAHRHDVGVAVGHLLRPDADTWRRCRRPHRLNRAHVDGPDGARKRRAMAARPGSTARSSIAPPSG